MHDFLRVLGLGPAEIAASQTKITYFHSLNCLRMNLDGSIWADLAADVIACATIENLLVHRNSCCSVSLAC